jgi:hypothetical protein
MSLLIRDGRPAKRRFCRVELRWDGHQRRVCAYPDKIESLNYLDAFVPDEGKALIGYVSSDVRKMSDARKDANMPVVPLRFEAFGLSDLKIIDFNTIPTINRNSTYKATTPTSTRWRNASGSRLLNGVLPK